MANPLDAHISNSAGTNDLKVPPLPRLSDFIRQYGPVNGPTTFDEAMEQWRQQHERQINYLLAGKGSPPAQSATVTTAPTATPPQGLTPSSPSAPATPAAGYPKHGHGPPDSGAGTPGDTYVDDDTDGFYWRTLSGWKP